MALAIQQWSWSKVFAILAVRPCPYICTRSDIKISWHSIRRFLSKGKEAQAFVEWFTGENIGIIGLRRHSHAISSSILHLMIWWNIIYTWRCFLVTIENKTVPSGTEKEVHSCWNLYSFFYCSQISMYEIRQNKLIFYWCRINKNINELFNPKVCHYHCYNTNVHVFVLVRTFAIEWSILVTCIKKWILLIFVLANNTYII